MHKREKATLTITIVLMMINFNLDEYLMIFALVFLFAIIPVTYLTFPSEMWRRDKIKA